MFVSESYSNVAIKNQLTKYESDISWDSVSLYRRSISDSDNSLIGRNGSSYDSGHDSYLEDGTGYSGDDEEALRCDICSCLCKNATFSEMDGKNRKRKPKKKRRERRRWRGINHALSTKLPDYGDTIYDFEGSASNEKKWTMEYYFDPERLMHRLKRVVIARQGNEDDFENMVVLETNPGFAMNSQWRLDVLQQTRDRNQREASDFEILPTISSCVSCLEKRGEIIKNAVNEGTGFKQTGLLEDIDSEVVNRNKKNNGCRGNWRKNILYDLKFGHCQIISFLNSQCRRETAPSNGLNVVGKPAVQAISIKEENEWEAYDVISDDDTIL